MTDHDEVPSHGRHDRSRREYRDTDERIHGGDLYTHGRRAPDAGTSWAGPPDQARRRDDQYPRQAPGRDAGDFRDGRGGGDHRDQGGRADPGERGARRPRPSYGDRANPPRPQPGPRPVPRYVADPRHDPDPRGTTEVRPGGREYPDDRRHPQPGRPAGRPAGGYPGAERPSPASPASAASAASAASVASVASVAPVGYANGDDPYRRADPHHGYGGPYRQDEPYRQDGLYRQDNLYGQDGLYRQDDPYDDDPYDDDPYGVSPPGDGPGGRHRRPGGTGGRRWVTYAKRGAAVLGVLVLLAGGFVFYEYKHLDDNIARVDVLQTQDTNIRQAGKQKNAENFLLIGSDSRAGTDGKFGEDVEGARSDTTILAHLSPNHDKAILISIPRDSWVDIPPCVQPNGQSTVEQAGQFNSAFAVGGANCTIRTVQKLTGIAVTHYVQVDFTGFESMVHALDGISMCSTVNAFDPVSGLRLRKGNNLLDGAQALAYVRARHNLGDNSDLDRITRQQRFLGAMMRKALSGGVLLHPVKLQRFLSAATKSLTMDKDTHIGDLKDLATVLHGLDPARVSFITPFIANRAYDPNDPSNPKGGRVLLDDQKNRALFDSIINDKTARPTATATSAAPKPNTPANQPKITVAPDEVHVYVYNGVGTNGLAGQVRDSLSGLGFTIATVGNQGDGLVASEVHYGPGYIDQARTLAAAVPGAVLKEDPHYQRSVALVVGSNYNGVRQVNVGDPFRSGQGAATSPHPNGPITPSGAINAADTTCGS